jgi:hypothetical protein
MDFQTEGKLDRALCYLSGPMEYVADHGVEWRRKFVRLAKEAKLKLDFIDPTDKPGGEDIKIGENKEHQEMLQRQGRWVELRNYVHRYRRYDLRSVDFCDFIIAVIDPRVPQWGTANEIYFAEMEHKPIFFIVEGGLFKLPRWLFDVVDIDDYMRGTQCNVYESVEAVIEVLTELNDGRRHMDDRWVLMRKHIERARED